MVSLKQPIEAAQLEYETLGFIGFNCQVKSEAVTLPVFLGFNGLFVH
jgi:hypothetical protein